MAEGVHLTKKRESRMYCAAPEDFHEDGSFSGQTHAVKTLH